MTTAKGALDGLVILDLSRILAGPTATQMLGDLGAKVIKVENPKTGGDDTRSWGPNYARDAKGEKTDLSAYFMSANRNKYSVAVDLSTPEGQETIKALAARADVIVENYKPGGLQKYGLDYETLLAAHPSLVYCSISGFGQTGPNRTRPGYDLMAQGFAGIMSLTGEPDGMPSKVGVAVADVVCGMYASIGILAALRHRDATGEGQHIDLSLVDSTMSWLINQGTNYLTTGQDPVRTGNAHPNIVPYEAFATSDGHILLAIGNDGQFTRFCDAFGLQDLAQDPAYQSNLARVKNRETLIARISETLSALPMDEVMTRCEAALVPAGPIHTVHGALTSQQAIARGAVQKVSGPDLENGHVKLLANPLKLSATPVRYERPPPRFGQDTNEILEWLAKS